MSKQGGEQLTFYPGVSHASRFPSPGSEEAQRMTVTSGRRCCELLTNSDPLSLLAKMLPVSSRWQSRLVTLQWKAETLPLTRIVTRERSIAKRSDMSSSEYCKTLNVSVIKSSYLYFRLVPSTPRTDATECALSPTGMPQMIGTPTADMPMCGRSEAFRKGRTPNPVEFAQMFSTPTSCEWKGRGPNSKQQGLAEVAKMWPTPTAYDWNTAVKGRTLQGSSEYKSNLKEAVQMFPTPTTPRPHDSENTVGKYYPSQNQFDLTAAVQMYPTPTVGAPLCGGSGNYEQLNGTITEYEKRQMAQHGGGQLNPDWVEWLMGFPVGWTDISKDVPLPEYDPHWYDAEPDIPRTATSVPNRVDRLKCEGNAVDPYQFYPVMECIATILKEIK